MNNRFSPFCLVINMFKLQVRGGDAGLLGCICYLCGEMFSYHQVTSTSYVCRCRHVLPLVSRVEMLKFTVNYLCKNYNIGLYKNMQKKKMLIFKWIENLL